MDNHSAAAPELDPPLLRELRDAGARLVEALRDQLADGQVEQIYSLQQGAGQLARSSQELERAAHNAADLLSASMTNAVAGLTAELTAGFGRLGAAMAEQLAAVVSDSLEEMQAAADSLLERLTAKLEATESLAVRVDASVERAVSALTAATLLKETPPPVAKRVAAKKVVAKKVAVKKDVAKRVAPARTAAPARPSPRQEKT